MTDPAPRERVSQRFSRLADRVMVFRMVVAGGALFAGLVWPFAHMWVERVIVKSEHPGGLDWDSIAFWTFCLLVFLAATYPETKGFLAELAAPIRAWWQRRKDGNGGDA